MGDQVCRNQEEKVPSRDGQSVQDPGGRSWDSKGIVGRGVWLGQRVRERVARGEVREEARGCVAD